MLQRVCYLVVPRRSRPGSGRSGRDRRGPQATRNRRLQGFTSHRRRRKKRDEKRFEGGGQMVRGPRTAGQTKRAGLRSWNPSSIAVAVETIRKPGLGGIHGPRPQHGPSPRACGTAGGRGSSQCPRTDRARGRSRRCSCPGSCPASPAAPAR